jgi:hypothetical protein
MEVLAPVSYGANDIKRFVNKVGGCVSGEVPLISLLPTTR